MKIMHSIGVGIGVLLLVVQSGAQMISQEVIVDYAGDAANHHYARTPDTETLTGVTWDFSTTSALITAPGTSSTVYGGFVTTFTADEPYIPWVRDNRNPDLEIRVITDPHSETSAKGMFAWNKADFLNGGDALPVHFNSGDSMTLTISTWAATSKEVRFSVNQGGTWYVTDDGLFSGLDQTWTIDPTEKTWRSLSTDNTYTIGETASTLTFDDVQGVGIYLDTARSPAQQTQIMFSDFSVEATVIPEPVSVSLVGLGVALVVAARRRRR